MFHIALFEPEIPPNTGNIIRLCHNTGATLHLIHPLGFDLQEKKLRRAGLDYIEWQAVHEYQNYTDLLTSLKPARIFAISTKGQTLHHQVNYQPHDLFLFGPETRGLPDHIREHDAITDVIRIPMLADSRSLNLSNSVSVIVYEAWRQLDYSGHSF